MNPHHSNGQNRPDRMVRQKENRPWRARLLACGLFLTLAGLSSAAQAEFLVVFGHNINGEAVCEKYDPKVVYDYHSVQTAINNSKDGDEIVMCAAGSDLYFDFSKINHRLTLRGYSGNREDVYFSCKSIKASGGSASVTFKNMTMYYNVNCGSTMPFDLNPGDDVSYTFENILIHDARSGSIKIQRSGNVTIKNVEIAHHIALYYSGGNAIYLGECQR